MNRILILITLLVSGFLSGQIKTEKQTLNFSDGKAFFNVITDDNLNLEFDENLEYRWYNEYSGLKTTQGGSGGKLLHGKYQAFDSKGTLRYENNYFKGLQNGIQKEWDAEGKLIETYKYDKGKRYYSKFPSKDGNNIIEYNGAMLENGTIKKVYDNYGKLVQEEKALPNLKREIKNYHYSGKIKDTYTTDYMGKMYNQFISYYSNGNIQCKGNYENNNRIGTWEWFKEDGTSDGKEKYRIGEIYRDDNSLLGKGGEYFDEELQEWIKNGDWIYYKEDGKTISDFKKYEYGEEIQGK